MTVPDDSSLLHARAPYDPAKAREYYLRTRKLKGRRRARVVAPKAVGRPHAVPVHTKKRTSANELQAQREALERRLDQLRDILAQKVKEAKRRSGIKDTTVHKTSREKAASSKSKSHEKPLTAAQKREKAKKAREDYKPKSDAQEIVQLREQIADIRAKIAAAIKDAQEQHRKSTHQTAPKGR